MTSLVGALLHLTKVVGLFPAGQSTSGSLRAQYPPGGHLFPAQIGGGDGQGGAVEHPYDGHPLCPREAGGLEPFLSTLCGPHLSCSPV